MKIKIITTIEASVSTVKSGFTEELFLSLNPPFPPVKLLRFDGCEKGDAVSLELNFIFFKQKWTSDITEAGETSDQWYFTDEGVQLPFFLKTWKHRHVVEKHGDGSKIVDDIAYSTGTMLTNLLMYPILYLQFLYRKPVYKRFF